MLKNPNFNNGWTDLPPTPDYLTNQQPINWKLKWLASGEMLWDSNDTAAGIPECVHKHIDNLPPSEQPGQPGALVLIPPYVYKIFHASLPFGAELTQTVTGLKPSTIGTLTVPVLIDTHGDHDAYSAEVFVQVNNVGRWENTGTIGSRKWFQHKVTFPIPANGRINITIRVKSKWNTAKDFFLDSIVLDGPVDDTPPPPPPPPTNIIPIPDGATGFTWNYE